MGALSTTSQPSTNRPLTEQWRLSSLEMGRPLGKGQFGRVYLVRTKTRPAFILALKTIYKSEVIAAKLEAQVRREIEIQSNLRSVISTSFVRVSHLTRYPDIPTYSDSTATSMMRSDYSSCWSMLLMASCIDS
jgi:serine/threonine protein kinase